jgi:heme A synthase
MLIIAVGLAVVSALFWYLMVANFGVATVCATITAVLAELLVAGPHIGGADNVYYENLAILAATSLAASIAVGGLVRYAQRRQSSHHGAP